MKHPYFILNTYLNNNYIKEVYKKFLKNFICYKLYKLYIIIYLFICNTVLNVYYFKLKYIFSNKN